MDFTCPSGHKILVVDDDADWRGAIADGLELSGFVVAVACDGTVALQILQSFDAAVVVTDLQMPRMHGIELLDRLRRIDARLPVIVMTGAGEPEADAARRLGAFHLLRKPFSIEQIAGAVTAALQHRADGTPLARLWAAAGASPE
jgi:two-component system C4-dicarboxylate transport response regulator DctD